MILVWHRFVKRIWTNWPRVCVRRTARKCGRLIVCRRGRGWSCAGSAALLAVAFVYRGKAAAAAGVEAQSLLGRRGCVWSWTGESVDGCAKSFFRASCAALDYFLTLYPLLYAACDVRYATARRYLRRLGAREAGAGVLFGGEGNPLCTVCFFTSGRGVILV